MCFFERKAEVLVRVDGDRVSFDEVAIEDVGRQRVLDLLLDDPLQGARPERGIVTPLRELSLGGIGDKQVQTPIDESFLQILNLNLEDVLEMFLAQGV